MVAEMSIYFLVVLWSKPSHFFLIACKSTVSMLSSIVNYTVCCLSTHAQKTHEHGEVEILGEELEAKTRAITLKRRDRFTNVQT